MPVKSEELTGIFKTYFIGKVFPSSKNIHPCYRYPYLGNFHVLQPELTLQSVPVQTVESTVEVGDFGFSFKVGFLSR